MTRHNLPADPPAFDMEKATEVARLQAQETRVRALAKNWMKASRDAGDEGSIAAMATLLLAALDTKEGDEYERMMQDIAVALDQTFNGDFEGGVDRKTGFVLMTFPFDSDDGRCNYISNGADRRDILKLLKGQVARFEEQIAAEEQTES